MIQKIEEFRAELNVECFGNLGDMEIPVKRHIPRGQTRPVQRIAARIPQNVGAELLAWGSWQGIFRESIRNASERIRCRCRRQGRGRNGRREAGGVQIVHAAINRIASGNEIRESH